MRSMNLVFTDWTGQFFAIHHNSEQAFVEELQEDLQGILQNNSLNPEVHNQELLFF